MNVAEAASKLMQLSSEAALCHIVWAAAELRLADATYDQPQTVEALAAKLSLHPPSLERLLNALAVSGYFSRNEQGQYAPTPLGAQLRADDPDSLWCYVIARFGSAHQDAFHKIAESVKTGVSAFELEHGKPSFDWYGENPEVGQMFARAMTVTTKAIDKAILAAHDFGVFEHAIDVGGSQGSLLISLLANYAQAQGVIFDRPEVIEAGRDNWSRSPVAARLQGVGGDFFAAVPSGDLYLLKQILHDWSDEDSIAILRNVRKAAAPTARLAIVEFVLPEKIVEHPGWMADINMMVFTGGQERSLSQFDRLLKKSGFERTKVSMTPMGIGIIEAKQV